jgi:hypothetical protein
MIRHATRRMVDRSSAVGAPPTSGIASSFVVWEIASFKLDLPGMNR